jgi:RHS repeat-associated protein
VSYTYDALGNRIGMDENGTQTWTLYDGSDPIMDFNSSGSLEMRYLNGPTGDLVDTVIARESAGGTIAWYLPDRLGTIRDLINNSGGIIDHVDYSAFGTVLDESSPSNGDRMMGFAGMERDTVTGLNLAVNRVQNPGTGRWTSQDPLGFAAGDPDLFVYAFNLPIDLSDSTGEDVRLENTGAVGGWHRRVSVDTPNRPYNIGFGPGSEEWPITNPLGGLVGTPMGPSEGGSGNGVVTVDWAPSISIGDVLQTTAEEDRIIQKYLESLVGQKGGYNPHGYNCRTFAEGQFNKIKQWLQRRHAPPPALPPVRTPPKRPRIRRSRHGGS